MIVSEHEEFAQAIVELARKHKVNYVKCEFRLDAFQRRNDIELPRNAFENINMSWYQGRHQEPGKITLRTEATKEFTEVKK